jgi:hypothetical protein
MKKTKAVFLSVFVAGDGKDINVGRWTIPRGNLIL